MYDLQIYITRVDFLSPATCILCTQNISSETLKPRCTSYPRIDGIPTAVYNCLVVGAPVVKNATHGVWVSMGGGAPHSRLWRMISFAPSVPSPSPPVISTWKPPRLEVSAFVSNCSLFCLCVCAGGGGAGGRVEERNKRKEREKQVYVWSGVSFQQQQQNWDFIISSQ